MTRLRVRELHRGETLRVQAVESIDVQRVRSDNGYRLFAQLQPVAVIVGDADAVKAFDMAAQEIDLANLRALVPELSGDTDKVSRVSMGAGLASRREPGRESSDDRSRDDRNIE